MKNKLQKILKYLPQIIARSKLWPFNKIVQFCLFLPEIKAVEKGIKNYKSKNLYSVETQLRRNIHRIEKGLINKNPRSFFALKYISETLDALFALYQQNQKSSTLLWSIDVLSLYFKTVDVNYNAVIKTAFIRFSAFIAKNELKAKGDIIPFSVLERKKSTVAYEDLYDLFKQRRSIRSYLKKRVEREVVEQAIEAALWSPSGCNRQPFEFVIIDEPELLQKAAEIPPGSISFAPDAPIIIFVLGNLNAYFNEKDRHLIYIDSSMAVMSFVLALESLGLSSCIINFPDLKTEDQKLRNLIQMEDSQRCIMAITIGYPSDELLVPSSFKKKKNEVIRYN